KNRRKNTDFWRACRYLAPYRRIVAISILCAFAVGFITTLGLGAMLPLLRVLIRGQTVQAWLDQQITPHYPSLTNLPWYLAAARGTIDTPCRLVQDAQGLKDGYKNILEQAIQEPIRAASVFVAALILSWKLTLLIVVFAPVMAWSIKKFGKKMRRASRAAMQR